METKLLIHIFPLMSGGNKKVKHTQTFQLSGAGLFKYVRPFCYHQALKGQDPMYGTLTFLLDQEKSQKILLQACIFFRLLISF